MFGFKYAKRLMELEDMALNNMYSDDLTFEEKYYIVCARIIPFREFSKDLELFEKGYISEDDFYLYLINKYRATDEELRNRYHQIKILLRYQKYTLNKTLKEQKKMIKRMSR